MSNSEPEKQSKFVLFAVILFIFIGGTGLGVLSFGGINGLSSIFGATNPSIQCQSEFASSFIRKQVSSSLKVQPEVIIFSGFTTVDTSGKRKTCTVIVANENQKYFIQYVLAVSDDNQTSTIQITAANKIN
jgi:hypothetical protein